MLYALCTTCIQAMIDIAANEGWLATTLLGSQVLQMVVQGRWASDSSLLTLPHLLEDHVQLLSLGFTTWRKTNKCSVLEVTSLPELMEVFDQDASFLQFALGKVLTSSQLKEVSLLSALTAHLLKVQIKLYFNQTINH